MQRHVGHSIGRPVIAIKGMGKCGGSVLAFCWMSPDGPPPPPAPNTDTRRTSGPQSRSTRIRRISDECRHSCSVPLTRADPTDRYTYL